MDEINLKQEILDDLTAELQIADEDFNENLLSAKLNNVIREVRLARDYPENYTEEMIEADMQRFYSNIRNLTLYDYNQIGEEFQSSNNMNEVHKSYIDRNELFTGINKLTRTSRKRSGS